MRWRGFFVGCALAGLFAPLAFSQTITGAGGSTAAAGSNTQVQYNSGGAFAGASGVTTNGTNITVTGAIAGGSAAVLGAAAEHGFAPRSTTALGAGQAVIGITANGASGGLTTYAIAGAQGNNSSTVLWYISANGRLIRQTADTVTNIGTASAAGAGARAAVTDATACTFNSAVTGGGATFCPVVSDGTNWKAG